MNIYITGGSGFIGHQLTRKLKSYGISVTNIPRTQLQDLSSFNFKNNSCLVHLAAHVHNMSVKDKAKDDRLHFSVNRDLTYSLAKKFFTEVPDGKLIFSSTVHTHGKSTNGVFNIRENAIPDSIYGQSKLEAEQLLNKISKSEGFSGQIIALRLPMIYGKNNKGNILQFISIASKKVKLPLKAFSNPRSLLYVKNLTHILYKLINADVKSKYLCYFATDNLPKSSNQIYNEIYTCLNASNGTFYIPKFFIFSIFLVCQIIKSVFIPSFPFSKDSFYKLSLEYCFDGDKLIRDFDITLPYNFSNAIKETVLDK